jgi:regulator of RNase E activity RraA
LPDPHARRPDSALGYELHDMPSPLDPDLVAALARVETASIGHFRDAGIMHGLHALLPDTRAAGTAVTLSLPLPDSTLLDHVIGLCRPGDVLVIDQLGDRRHASWGGVLSMIGKTIGLAGVAIDGTATDVGDIRRAGLPIWCCGLSAVTTQRLGTGGVLNGPVTCGGVPVSPGDAIIADENGVLVVPAREAPEIARLGEEFRKAEAQLVERLKRGETLGVLTGATAAVMANLKGKNH